MTLMDNAPHDFCVNVSDQQLKKVLGFKHRTFNDTDLLYFIEFFKFHYAINDSLETAFTKWMNKKDETIETALKGFYEYFFSLETLRPGKRKHLTYLIKKSTGKRLWMFLR